MSARGSYVGQSARMRTLLALVVAPAVGSVAYVVLASLGLESHPMAGAKTWTLILPALLVGTLFEVFVLLPLWHLLQPVRGRRQLLFAASGAGAWVLCAVGLLLPADLRGGEMLGEATRLFAPGVLLVLIFEILARREAGGPE